MLDISRHRELIDTEVFDTPIHIIGVGSTGSWLALIFAKLGIRGDLINVYDFDTVEEHNIPNQAYGVEDVDSNKAKAIASEIYAVTNTTIKYHPVKYVAQPLSGYVFLMVDSMAERKRIWENCIKYKYPIKLMVEPRMGMDVGRIYNVNPLSSTHIKKYEDTYYEDDVAEVSACGTSMTVISTAISLAGMISRQLINHYNDVELDNEILIDFKYNNIVACDF